MEAQLVWKVLGMEPTKEEEELKNRYHELLRGVNPEDDPEGFKRLREAYEQAMSLAKQPEEQEEAGEKPKDEIDLWLDRVNDRYWYKSTRNNPEVWMELFDDPVCVALDTALEARERFLVFLMSHNNFDQEIWKLIDKEFDIIADKKELEELFPRDFLDYIQYQVENPNFFPYELLEVKGLDESEIQLDTYIIGYLRIKAQIDREEYDNQWQALEDLSAYEVYHPYEDVERVRLYIHEDKKEQAVELIQRLLDDYPDEVYIGYFAGRTYWAAEEWERAYQCWKHVEECLPEHYGARVGIAKYYMKCNDNLKAKDLIMDLLEINGRDDSLLEMMREVNVPLIDYYHELAAKEPENKAHAVEACWCMFQNEMFTETIEELDKLQIQTEESEYYDYVNMKGRCYLGLEQYTEALEYLLQWEENRKKLVDDGSEKYKKRQSREGFIKSTIGVVYQNLENFEKAEAYLKEGIALEQDAFVRHSFMDRLALLYYDNNKTEQCVDVCSEIIEEDAGYYPAYLRRQQAYFDLQDGNNVVNDYYNAIHIFPKYYKPYLLAVRVFCIYRQYEDAKKVLDAAKEQDVQQELLDFYEIRVLRNLARTEEENRRVMELCQKLKQKVHRSDGQEPKEEVDESTMSEAELVEQDMRRDGMPQDKVVMDDLIFEEILITMDLNQSEDAMRLIQAELKKGSTNYRLHWVKADIHRMNHEDEEALKEYDYLTHEMPDNEEIDYNRGICLRNLGKLDEAIQAFQTVLQKEPKHPRANHELMKIYNRRYDQYELKSAYGKALKAINAQLELVPDAYYYIERGLLYMDNFNMELALADYQKALELEPENIYAYNNIGFVYQSQGKFREAIEQFKKSISLMTEDSTMLPYTNMARCYEALLEPEHGIEILQEAMKRFSPSASLYNKLGELYEFNGQFEKARQIYEEALKQESLSIFDYYDKMADNYVMSGDMPAARDIYRKWMDRAKHLKEDNRYTWRMRMESLEETGAFYFFQRDLKNAIKYLEEAMKLAEKKSLASEWVGRHLARAYMLAGQKEKAKVQAKKTLEAFLKSNHIPEELKRKEPENPETIEYFLDYRSRTPQRLDTIAQLFICMGDFQRASQYLARISQVPRCRSCSFATCYDSYITHAFLAEVQGDIPRAIQIYEKALVVNPGDSEVVLALWALKKKKK